MLVENQQFELLSWQVCKRVQRFLVEVAKDLYSRKATTVSPRFQEFLTKLEHRNSCRRQILPMMRPHHLKLTLLALQKGPIQIEREKVAQRNTCLVRTKSTSSSLRNSSRQHMWELDDQGTTHSTRGPCNQIPIHAAEYWSHPQEARYALRYCWSRGIRE